MGIVLDIIIVAGIALSIFLGYKQGLVGVAYKILSFIVALVLAFVLSGPVSQFLIENTELDETIHNTIEKTLSSKESENKTETENNIVNDSKSENETKVENDSNMSAVITDYVAEQVKKTTADVQNNVATTVADGVTNNIVYAITFIGIFIIARILLIVIKFFAEAIAKLPIIKQFNEIGGLLYGVLRGLLLVFLFFAIVSLLASIFDIKGFLEVINSSFIGKFAYNNNLLLKILF